MVLSLGTQLLMKRGGGGAVQTGDAGGGWGVHIDTFSLLLTCTPCALHQAAEQTSPLAALK